MRSLALASVVFLHLTCDRRPELPAPTQDTGTLSGTLLIGPVQGATLRVFRLVQGERGAEVGRATIAQDGSFQVGVGISEGPFLLVASSGSLKDAATGAWVSLDSEELTALVPRFLPGSRLEGVRLTAVSHLAAGLALHSAQRQDPLLEEADADVWRLLVRHFGVDFRVTTPVDLTSGGGPAMDGPTRAGLVLAGLSMHARLISEAAGLTPGGSVNALTLTQALYQDAFAEGVFDGSGTLGGLVLPVDGDQGEDSRSYALGGATLRAHLAQAIARFLASERNASAITLADAQGYLLRLADSDVPRLFPPGEPEPADLQAPHLAFLRPATGAGVNGQVLLTVRALDDRGVASLRFTAPPELAGLAPSFDAEGKRALLTASWDVSSYEDGPVRLSVESRDSVGNLSREELTVQVAHQGPALFVDTPADGGALRGSVTLTARAEPRQGRVASLTLVNAAALGVGDDEALEATRFRASWDTERAPEGDVALHFRAEDTFGIRSDFTLLVKVNNVALGQVAVVATLGAPLSGATVRLVAVDDATGEPVLGRPGGAVLGQGTTDSTGTARFTLSELSGENWDGPVQLVAGGYGLAYVDPSSPAQAATVVSLSSGVHLTSYLPRYRSGQALPLLPLTLWTSLADAAAVALARGSHRDWPVQRPLSASLSVTDPLLAHHLVAPTRDTWSLREAVPVLLTASGSPTLRDSVYAALPDVALNQLARDASLAGGYEPGTAFTAVTLLRLLREDLLADGQFDGLGEGGQALDAPSYALSADTTRAALAASLDRFIASPQQKLGLTRAALQAQGVYEAMASDTSLLYPSGASPGPVDPQPPSVTFTATYEDALGAGQAPQRGRYVHGRLSVTVAAADTSGVAELVVRLNGVLIPPAPGSTTERQHFVYQHRGQPDGELLFEATARDTVGNSSGPQRLSLAHDDSPPAIAVLQGRPTPGGVYGTAGVPVEASAVDSGSGVASLLHSGFDGLTDSDARPEGLNGTWEDPPEGPATLRLTACDLLGNCAATPVPVTVDRTPPTLLVLSTPAEYVNTPRVRFTVAAADSGGSTVAGVYARNGTRVFTGQEANGRWTLEAELTEGRNPLTFWAEDASGNSGEGLATSPSLTVTLDTQPPTLDPLPCACFIPEGEMGFEVNATGVPVMPAVYTFGNATKVDPAHSLIVKAATRLSYGSPAPTLNELVNQEAKALNVPFLLFETGVGLDEAPFTRVSYSVTCEPAHLCTGVSQGSAPLITQTDAMGAGRYLLPITAETVTGLGAITGEVMLTFTLTVSDAAGNTSHLLLAPVRFQLAAAPVSWRNDRDWRSASDEKSTFPYTIAKQNYEQLFAPPPGQFPDDAVRLVLMRVYNPAPYPVAVSVALTDLPNSVDANQYSAWETWKDTVTATNLWRSFGSGDGCGQEPGPPPCPIPQSFRLDYSCLEEGPPLPDPAEVKVAFANLRVTAHIAQATAGPDVRVADTTASGHFIVPAATHNTPATLNLYINRPYSTITRTTEYSLETEGPPPGGTPPLSYIDTQSAFKWMRTENCQTQPLDHYRQYTWIRWLHRAETRLAVEATLSSALLPGLQNTEPHRRTISSIMIAERFSQ